jgi:hypothetical protein
MFGADGRISDLDIASDDLPAEHPTIYCIVERIAEVTVPPFSLGQFQRGMPYGLSDWVRTRPKAVSASTPPAATFAP